MASRILGMGDVLTLIEKAQETVDIEEAEQVAKRLEKAQFTLEDFRSQLRQIQKMGPLHQVLGMLPGMGSMKNIDPSQIDDKRIKRLEAILDSMTPYERSHPRIFNGSRRRRVAMGSGVSVTEVNQLLKQFQMMRKMMQKMKKGNMKNMMRALDRYR
jgi:signal recognition particle subunit SRP54